MEIKVDLNHWSSIFHGEYQLKKKNNKVLTVFEFGLDSQARVEDFQTIDCSLTPYPFQVKVLLKLFELNLYMFNNL
jgi:hypothetical protein